MSRKRYGQFCGVSRALELIGERWTILIVRDLLVRPKRYTDLRRGLPGIPTNVLSDRLKELERNGIVRRHVRPRPDGMIVYELTEYGNDLEDIILQLGRWGARALGEPAAGEIVTGDSFVMALRSTFQPDAAVGRRVGYELRSGEVVVHARVEDGVLLAGLGGLPGADLVIEAGPALRALMAGEISAAEAIGSGEVRVAGDPDLLTGFAELFRIGKRQ